MCQTDVSHFPRRRNTKKWKYQLCALSRQLRAAINNNNDTLDAYKKILGILKDCYDKIHAFVNMVDWWSIKPAYDKLNNDISILTDEFETDYIYHLKRAGYNSENPILECVNSHLHKFYVVCHDAGIWVSTPFDLAD